MSTTPPRLGILVGGGPAPGINSAISSTVIEAINSGLEVMGIYDGFETLIAGRTESVRPLSIAEVSRIHSQGGSILRTSRANPTRQPEQLQRTVQTLRELDISYLVTIGGDDTAFAAAEVARAAEGGLRVAHIPKTIDNDLPLPDAAATFGFETARHVGTQMVLNLAEDSRTTRRWYFVVVMGRAAGHLALGIGNAAGATLTLIPEEFSQEHVSLDHVAKILEGAMLKRQAMGRDDGVAVIAEGIGTKLSTEELATVPGVVVEHDAYGHIRLGEIPLATVLRRKVQQRFAAREENIPIVESTLGYELRSAPPIPCDIDYTRTLGYTAVRFLLSEPSEEQLRLGALVCLDNSHSCPMSFDDLRDPDTGRTRVRVVDVQSDHYIAARKYMIRLEQRDLASSGMLSRLAASAKVSPEEFERDFGPVISPDSRRAAA